MHIDNMFRSNE